MCVCKFEMSEINHILFIGTSGLLTYAISTVIKELNIWEDLKNVWSYQFPKEQAFHQILVHAEQLKYWNVAWKSVRESPIIEWILCNKCSIQCSLCPWNANETCVIKRLLCYAFLDLEKAFHRVLWVVFIS